MKKILILAALVLVMGIATATNAVSATTATAGSWLPGTPYLISEMDASDALERKYDSAYCSGIPRFGHRGEFPYEEFIIFDCTLTLDDLYCSDVRYKSVKGSKRGYFRLNKIRNGDCF